MMRARLSRLAGTAAAYGVLAFLAIFALGPIALTLVISLRPEGDIIAGASSLVPTRLTLENYAALWSGTEVGRLMLNSLVVTTLTTMLCLGTGIPAAHALARLDFRGRDMLGSGLLLLRMVPSVLILVPLFIMMQAGGLLDTRIGLALSYGALLLPFCIWMLRGFLAAVPRELEDAARLDGCTRLGAMLRIVLPLAKTGIGSTMLLVAISAWNEFLFALMLTSSAGARTWPVGLRLMVVRVPAALGHAGGGGHRYHLARDPAFRAAAAGRVERRRWDRAPDLR